MLKKIINIILLLFLSIVMFISIKNSILLIIIDYLFPILICMIIRYNKKRNMLYKISMDILIVVFGIFIIYVLYSLFTTSVSWDTFEVLLASINHIIINILLYLNILNIKKCEKSKFIYINMLTTLIISFIYLNYYFNGLFIHNIVSNDMINSYSILYINQNYPYFLTIEICLFTYYLINNNLEN